MSEIVPLGSYVAVRVLQPSRDTFIKHFEGLDIKSSEFERRLHTTVIFSRKYNKDIEVNPTRTFTADCIGYDIFSDIFSDVKGNPGVLVMKLNCPALYARHIRLMAKYNLTYDFPVYQPHITIAFNVDRSILDTLKPFNDPIILGDEYVEDLDTV